MPYNFTLKSFLFYLAVAALLTPFLVQTATYFPFITLKNTAFRFIVEIMLVLWLILWVKDKKSSGRLTPVVKSVLIYGLIIFASALLGVNFWWSFFLATKEWRECLAFGILFYFS